MKDELRMTVRLPRDAVEFLDGMADHNFTSRNAEIVRSIREQKVRVEASASTPATGRRLDAEAPAAGYDTTVLADGDIATNGFRGAIDDREP